MEQEKRKRDHLHILCFHLALSHSEWYVKKGHISILLPSLTHVMRGSQYVSFSYNISLTGKVLQLRSFPTIYIQWPHKGCLQGQVTRSAPPEPRVQTTCLLNHPLWELSKLLFKAQLAVSFLQQNNMTASYRSI